ncbi:MAG: RNA polymerase sigma factor RpoE [Gammaproteobacteria bacterium]|nr:MAG: RNA polymerase sigma factor RpoE [Gammaproteobacteria bacterium]
MTTDEQLAAAAQQGADSAFSELVERYQLRLLRFLLARSASRADAEDAVQDTFVNAYRYLHSYDSRWRFSTWLYRIALRNAARQSRAGMMPAAEPTDEQDDPLAACIAASARENLWLAARRLLSADAYAAMWLRYVEDLPLADVAKALQRPLPWTKVTLMRARRRLGRELAQDDRSENYG